jgi:hypothetical protein
VGSLPRLDLSEDLGGPVFCLAGFRLGDGAGLGTVEVDPHHSRNRHKELTAKLERDGDPDVVAKGASIAR